MIQAAMYFALGLLTAGLLILLVMPVMWRRMARLTRQRIECTVPTTLAEIEADKDQLRAEFAMSAHRLETTVSRLRDKTTEQLVEINEKRAEIVRLSNDRDDKAKTIADLEERAARLVADLAATDERLAKANETTKQREATLAERDSEIAALRGQLAAAHQLGDEQKLELVARDTEIGNLNDRLTDAKATEDALTAERDRLAESLAAEQATVAAERRRIANLEASIARIESERIDRLAELERRAAEARELLAELDKSRASVEELRTRVVELEADRTARNTEFGLHAGEVKAEHTTAAPGTTGAGEPDSANGDNVSKAIAAAERENAELSRRLADLEARYASLREENDGLRRVASDDWDIETENALLRERLAGVAADVIRLTGKPVVDGPAENGNGAASGNGAAPQAPQPPKPTQLPPAQHVSAPSQTPPAAESQQPASARAAAPPVAARPEEGKTLAERLRALQQTRH